MFRLILVLLLIAFIGFVLAVKYLPWWGIILFIVGIVIIGKLLAKFAFKRLLMLPFKAKGGVLRGATATVHSIETTAAPLANVEQSNQPAQLRHYYQLEVTITPTTPTTNFAHWEPGELLLVGPDAKPQVEDEDENPPCAIYQIEVEENGQFQRDVDKYNGPRRLRMVIGILPGVTKLQFRYYFELFGTIDLPALRLS